MNQALYWLSRLDDWAATKLFVPPIIKICQKTKLSQYALANYAVVIGTACLFWHWSEVREWGWAIFIGIILTLDVVMCALYPDMEVKPRRAWRLLEASMLVWTLCNPNPKDGYWESGFWFLMLVASYARGIDRIPPEEKKEKRRKTVTQWA